MVFGIGNAHATYHSVITYSLEAFGQIMLNMPLFLKNIYYNFFKAFSCRVIPERDFNVILAKFFIVQTSHVCVQNVTSEVIAS